MLRLDAAYRESWRAARFDGGKVPIWKLLELGCGALCDDGRFKLDLPLVPSGRE